MRDVLAGGSGPRALERIGQQRVIYHVQRQTDRWPDENATDRACVDNADAHVAYAASGRKGQDVDGAQTEIDKGGPSPRRKGENNAAELLAETAGCPQRLAPRIDFPIDTLKKCQSVHRQAMLVFFAIDKHFQ